MISLAGSLYTGNFVILKAVSEWSMTNLTRPRIFAVGLLLVRTGDILRLFEHARSSNMISSVHSVRKEREA